MDNPVTFSDITLLNTLATCANMTTDEVFKDFKIMANKKILQNQKYQIILKDMNIKKCAIHDRQIYVYSKNIQATIEMFLKQELMNYLKERIDFYLSTSFHHAFPEIQIKKMKRRWGACFYQKNRVCFNLVLAHIDYALIDYVIVHELCHFLEANHSKAFYHEIEKRMPDYKERERLLKDVGI